MSKLDIYIEDNECFIVPSDNDQEVRRHFRAGSRLGLNLFLRDFIRVCKERGWHVVEHEAEIINQPLN